MSTVTTAYLRFHWEGPYRFAKANGKYTATATFGSHDVLEADSPAELLTMVRRHYPGLSGELSST
jgi:hypothetical protein